MLLLGFIICLLIKFVVLRDIKDMSTDEIMDLTKQVLQIKFVKPEDVSFYLFSRDRSNQKIYTNSSQSDIEINKKTKIVIHGWLEDHTRTWYQNLTNEYLIKGDYNIIQVDWQRISRSFYVTAAPETQLIGYQIAQFVLQHKFPLRNIHLIGLSLGAHVAAYAAKFIKQKTGKKVARITGLDPAGPYFRGFFVDDANKLGKEDAEFVDVIHTDGGFFGYYNPLGHLDIYVNGGRRIQPECLDFQIDSVGELVEQSFCSHARSSVIFIDMINEKKFTCYKCQLWPLYLTGFCNYEEKYIIGAEDVDKTMTGMCFIETSK